MRKPTTLLAAIGIAAVCAPGIRAQPNLLPGLLGQWTTLANQTPINPVHVALMNDGSVMTFSGLTETGTTNKAVEIFTVAAGWSPEFVASWTPPLYPRMHVLPDGRVFYSGSGRGSRFFDPSTKTWSEVVATTNYPG